MPTQNDFLPFATGPGANVVDRATYVSLTVLTTGFLSGTAQSIQVSKVWPRDREQWRIRKPSQRCKGRHSLDRQRDCGNYRNRGRHHSCVRIREWFEPDHDVWSCLQRERGDTGTLHFEQ